MKNTCLAVLFALSFAGPALATEDAAPAKPARVCLWAREVENTTIPDDHTILFHMQDGKVWRNTLKARCPNLKFEQGFAETIEGSEICANQQTITVLQTGTPCWLGDFTLEPKPVKAE